MPNPRWMLVAVVLAGAALARPAAAEDACMADAKRLCAATPAGGGRIYFCLRSSWNQLSQGCQSLLDWSQKRANEVNLDCQGDAFAYCQGVPPGQGRIYACLAGHRDQISSECKKGLELVDWFTASCGADRARLCPGIPVGDGGAIACLVTRRDQLSPACQAVFWP
jgi:hypothetical protein